MIVFFNIWVLFTLAIYYLGPIDWSGSHNPIVFFYVAICLSMFNVGTALPFKKLSTPNFSFPLPKAAWSAYLVVIAHFALALIYISEITGKNPLAISSYSMNFGEVYAEYGEQMVDRSRGIFSLLVTVCGAILFPIVLMIFFDRFKKDKIIVFLIFSTMIASSFLRGTDKEFVDVFVILFAAFFYHGLLRRRVWLLVPIAIIILDFFLLRRLGRFSGELPACLPGSDACFRYNGFVARTFGPDIEILWVFFSNYVSQGYEGLYKAISLPFDFNMMVGHLPPLKRSLCVIVDSLCEIPDYQAKLIDVGWDTSTRWETAYTIIANDFSFWLVPLYMTFLGMMYRAARENWNSFRDIPSLATLFLVLYFFIYSSANMQIAISLEWTMCTILFLYIGYFRIRFSWPR